MNYLRPKKLKVHTPTIWTKLTPETDEAIPPRGQPVKRANNLTFQSTCGKKDVHVANSPSGLVISEGNRQPSTETPRPRKIPYDFQSGRESIETLTVKKLHFGKKSSKN